MFYFSINIFILHFFLLLALSWIILFCYLSNAWMTCKEAYPRPNTRYWFSHSLLFTSFAFWTLFYFFSLKSVFYLVDSLSYILFYLRQLIFPISLMYFFLFCMGLIVLFSTYILDLSQVVHST